MAGEDGPCKIPEDIQMIVSDKIFMKIYFSVNDDGESIWRRDPPKS